jgi:DNA repair protein RAD7
MENCEICSKRFTVTPYSVAGPNGGLLCAPCGRKIAKEREQDQPKKKAPRRQTGGGVGSRRAVQSRILDGDIGVKSLATLCVQTLAKNVNMAESLGDLPEHMIDKIARIFSKRRLLKADTLPLFVQPTTETLHIYDGAKLSDQDLIYIFQTAPKLRRFKARSVVQFKDEVMDYLLSRDIILDSFYLHGANLLSEEKWHEFLVAKGKDLQGLQVYYTDKHFGDETMTVIAENCPSLRRLKVEKNQKVTDVGVQALAKMKSLEHIGLQLHNRPSSETIVSFITEIGENLKTLSLKLMPHANDTVLDAIHNSCRSLSKFRITESEDMTDKAFAKLFTDWENPPVEVIDLQKCRYVSATAPRTNANNVGLCSEGFKALMAHSGAAIRDLNVHACRNISREAFEEVFREDAHYPELMKLEISFCEEVTDFIIGCIFRACPKIKEVNVFGCMKVRDVRVPRGVILVGVPNAQGMILDGFD